MGFVLNAKRLADDVIDQRWIFTILKKGLHKEVPAITQPFPLPDNDPLTVI
jgi:hypothetical protein